MLKQLKDLAEMQKKLISQRNVRDQAVNNTRNGFERPDEVDRERYARMSGRNLGKRNL